MTGRPGSSRDDGAPYEIVDALHDLAERRDLSREQSRSVMRQIMEGGATASQIGAYLMGLRMKGETVAELTGAAEVMRALVTGVASNRRPLVDTCGTGGDLSGSYNVSTAVAFVAAGAGVAVAKHGNRSVSSKAGSADVLEALGVRIDLPPEGMSRCLDEVGIAFLYAPRLHGSMKHAAATRREMKLRTMFNLLGPLTNPAGAKRQLLGVFDGGFAERVAGVLRALGSEHAWVVHGADGMDEISITGPSVAFEVRGDAPIRRLEIDPTAYGLALGRREEIAGGDPQQNALWLTALLENRVDDGSRRMVTLNAAAALVVAGQAPGIPEGLALAESSLQTGRARATLEGLRKLTCELGGPA
ncbi:MAG: anthranilate phosphoribosyltransferase [Candidatus Eisenbacteria bacterium]